MSDLKQFQSGALSAEQLITLCTDENEPTQHTDTPALQGPVAVSLASDAVLQATAMQLDDDAKQDRKQPMDGQPVSAERKQA